MWKQLQEPNLDPVIYQPRANGRSYALTDWVGWCLAYVATAFKSGWAGASAWEAWNKTTHKRHFDRNFPVGVKFPIWFSGFGGDGHVAIMLKGSDGKISIWTSPYKNRQANAEVVHSIEQIERELSAYKVKYVGWSEDIGGTTVINQEGKVKGTMDEDINLVDEGGFRTLTDWAYNNPNPTQAEIDANVGKHWKQVIATIAVSKGRRDHVKYLQEATAFYEKYKGTDLSKSANDKANKLWETAQELMK